LRAIRLDSLGVVRGLLDEEHTKELYKMLVDNHATWMGDTDRVEKNDLVSSRVEGAFRVLGTEKPIITVPSAKILEFEGILKYYNFKLEGMYRDYYKKSMLGYVYNGELGRDSKSDS
jgi:hypothetical protein